ncbi:hypothetical protein DPM19_13885 [Actinomadura craniellae]|uniref:Uncharacterized protein n=1 Tax=Actinomadura craniellae TaxID=2231787 RepID=A0A365H753_9ACTN|nr:hypothetical protein DPM19_13885 [Actinomadura craniellae]
MPGGRRTVNGALAVVLVAAGTLGYLSLRGDGGSATAPRTVTVARGTLLASVSATGSVGSARTGDLDFGATGTIETINVQVGDTVRKGQVLATLDDAQLRDEVTAAKAALDAAGEGDTSTAAGYAAYLSAKSRHAQASRQLAGTTLTAPFAGTVTAVNGTVGGPATGSNTGSGGQTGDQAGGQSTSGNDSAGTGLVSIADTTRLEVNAMFTEADVAKLKRGQPATVGFDALPGTSASGKVAAIAQTPTTSNNVVQYEVRMSLDERPGGVRLGQTTKVSVVTGKAENVLYLPATAVRTAGGRGTVIVAAGDRRVTTMVETGLSGDRGIEIRSGLTEGARVLLPDAQTPAQEGGRARPGGPGGGFGGGGGLGGGVRGGGR